MKASIYQYPTIAEVNEALAKWLVNDINEVLANGDRYTMALSGGSTPKSFYELLARQYREQVNWAKVHIFFDDERYVPFTDERNNAAMVYRSLINSINIPAEQVHKMQTNLPPATSASAYEELLHRYFDGQPHTFDLVLLGMGDDGHTLSLFPGLEVVNEQQRWVKEVLMDEAGNYRITLTAPVVNRCRKAVFLVTGNAKAETLQKVINGPYQPNTFPSQIIQPINSKPLWFIDDAAASAL